MKEQIIKFWEKLVAPKHRKYVYLVIAIIVIVLFGKFASNAQDEAKTNKDEDEEETVDITYETKQLKKNLYNKTQNEFESYRKGLSDVSLRLEKLEKAEKERIENPFTSSETKVTNKKGIPDKLPALPDLNTVSKNSKIKNYQKFNSNNSKNFNFRSSKPAPEPDEIIGGISIISNTKYKNRKKIEVKKNDEEGILKVFLPVSYIKADLLTGIRAQTTRDAEENTPEIVFRAKDMAVLPKDIRADLEGCFIVGQVYGNLATERVDVRIRRLSCIAKNGQAVIEEKVKK